MIGDAQGAGFTGKYAGCSFRGGNPAACRSLPLREIAPQLLDRRIDMRSGYMRADAVKRGELMLQRGQNSVHAGIARRGR